VMTSVGGAQLGCTHSESHSAQSGDGVCQVENTFGMVAIAVAPAPQPSIPIRQPVASQVSNVISVQCDFGTTIGTSEARTAIACCRQRLDGALTSRNSSGKIVLRDAECASPGGSNASGTGRSTLLGQARRPCWESLDFA
jgi:hypothetical protein